MRKNKLMTDALVLIAFIVLASFYAYFVNGTIAGKSVLVGIVFTIPPTIYLSIRKKKNWKKIFGAVFLFGLIFGFAFSFLAEFTKSWEVVSTIFPQKILGIHTFDTTIGIMCMTLLTVVFYEHFIETRIRGAISIRFWHALLPAIFVVTAILLIYIIKPELLVSKYPYFILGCIAISPTIYLAFKNPGLIAKMAVTSIYFFFLYLIIEIFAVAHGYWIYPGDNYIGWVSFINIYFPIEELLFWMLFYTSSIISYYEILIDDEK